MINSTIVFKPHTDIICQRHMSMDDFKFLFAYKNKKKVAVNDNIVDYEVIVFRS